MDDYLSKPFREAEMREVLQRWLSCTTQEESAAVEICYDEVADTALDGQVLADI